ncbi:hypothetical protein Taro_009620 [Colocasia esculenta]|uniref:Uncharacterized protein n=1 Tax=Colocasia esculenta TaxID=4460 RepID=A0A843U0X1_COLES|nr:hypothetical protein [Colocasia esculenta]
MLYFRHPDCQFFFFLYCFSAPQSDGATLLPFWMQILYPLSSSLIFFFTVSFQIALILEREALRFLLVARFLPPALGPAMSAERVPPPPGGVVSYAQAVAASLQLPAVASKVHDQAFTDQGEPVVFFSKEEMSASLIPFKFALVAKT